MSLPHWIKWNNVIGEYEVNSNMKCFEQGRNMTQIRLNWEQLESVLDEVDKLRRYKGVSKQEKQRLYQNVVNELLKNRFV